MKQMISAGVRLGVTSLSAAVTLTCPFDATRSAMAAPFTVRNLMPSPSGVGPMPRIVGLLVRSPNRRRAS
jgi:hypothetical protein